MLRILGGTSKVSSMYFGLPEVKKDKSRFFVDEKLKDQGESKNIFENVRLHSV